MYDLIIIGAGPAGLTASLYAGRYRLNTLVLEKIAVGGSIMLSPDIENFPGFPKGISTQDLISRMKEQVDDVGVEIKLEEVLEILPIANAEPIVYKIKTKNATYDTKALIIATGAKPRRLNVEGEVRLTGRGVSYCGTCDAPLFRSKQVVVVGGGDRAIEEAIYLTSYASKVTVIHRRDSLRASKILEQKAKANGRIDFILDSVVEEIMGINITEEVKLKNVKTGIITKFSCQGVFIFVGIDPDTGFLKNQLRTDEAGFIIIDQESKTSNQAIFACGDCCKKNLYQVINACGEAAVAAYSVQRYLYFDGAKIAR